MNIYYTLKIMDYCIIGLEYTVIVILRRAVLYNQAISDLYLSDSQHVLYHY